MSAALSQHLENPAVCEVTSVTCDRIISLGFCTVGLFPLFSNGWIVWHMDFSVLYGRRNAAFQLEQHYSWVNFNTYHYGLYFLNSSFFWTSSIEWVKLPESKIRRLGADGAIINSVVIFTELCKRDFFIFTLQEGGCCHFCLSCYQSED